VTNLEAHDMHHDTPTRNKRNRVSLRIMNPPTRLKQGKLF
jgi:hypothetical protein